MPLMTSNVGPAFSSGGRSVDWEAVGVYAYPEEEDIVRGVREEDRETGREVHIRHQLPDCRDH
jgi:hypothetical protein